jgi:hypothetical protein
VEKEKEKEKKSPAKGEGLGEEIQWPEGIAQQEATCDVGRDLLLVC